jgi:hypothetical protein
VEDNNEDINQFEEMPLFTNPMNIKHIEREFDKAMEKLYTNYVSHFILMLVFVCMDLNLYEKFVWKIWISKFVSYNKIQMKLKTKFKQLMFMGCGPG